MRWAGHVARIEEIIINTKFWSENLKVKDHSEDIGLDGKIIVKCITRK